MASKRSRLAEDKARLRKTASARRRQQADKKVTSQRIVSRLLALPEYSSAATVMFYVNVRDEVQTITAIQGSLERKQRVVVPYCSGGELALFHLKSLNELQPGQFDILEPNPILRRQPTRRVSLVELDLIVVPGVAFDRTGGRMGHGFGYYDRLLAAAGPHTCFIGLAYECQLFDSVPAGPLDIVMHKIVTELTVYTRP